VLFQRDLLIEVGKTATDPATDTMKLCEGVITRYSVLFPAGCAGLAHVQVWLGGFQLIPWSRGLWLRGDDHLIEGATQYPVGPAPRLVTIKGYNEDTDNDHTVSVTLEVTPTWSSLIGTQPSDWLGMPVSAGL